MLTIIGNSNGTETHVYSDEIGVRDEWGQIIPQTVQIYETKRDGHRLITFMDYYGWYYPKKFLGANCPVAVWGEATWSPRLHKVHPIPFIPSDPEHSQFVNGYWWNCRDLYVGSLAEAQELSRYLWERKPTP